MTTQPATRLGTIGIIEALPTFVGHTPHHSLVMVGFVGPRVDCISRIDMPRTDEEAPAHVATAAQAFTTGAGHRWESVLIVLWDEAREDHGAATRARDDLALAALAHGKTIRGVYTVDAAEIRGRSTDPDGGTRLTHLPRQPEAADELRLLHISQGKAPFASREEAAASVAAGPQARDTEAATPQPLTTSEFLALWRRTIVNDEPVEPTAADVATLTHALTDYTQRDAVTCHLTGMHEILPSLGEAGQAVTTWPAPTDAMIERLRLLVTRVPDSAPVDALAVLAAAAHERRDGLLATVTAERAARNDPHHRLTALVQRMRQHGIFHHPR